MGYPQKKMKNGVYIYIYCGFIFIHRGRDNFTVLRSNLKQFPYELTRPDKQQQW